MDHVTTPQSQNNNEVGSATSWDPKKFICDHNAMRPGLAEKIVKQSQQQACLDKDLEENEKKLNEMQHFFAEYGKKHPESIVTLKIDDYHRRKWDLNSELESDLDFNEKHLLKLRKALKKLEENARQIDCPCLKSEI